MMHAPAVARFYVGTYSQPGAFYPRVSGEGVVWFDLDLASGAMRRAGACREGHNAVYIAFAPGRRLLLVAHDHYLDDGAVSAFAVQADGSLLRRSTQSARGTAVCHVECAPDGRRAFVSSYMNGRLSAHDLDADGRLGPADPVVVYSGSGPDAARQEAAHAHQASVSPSGRWLHVPDLGSDRLWVHDLRDRALPYQGLALPAGSGPRHLVHHPSLARTYVVCELTSQLLTFARDEATGRLLLEQDTPTLPAGWQGARAAAAIRLHPSGRALYLSDRGPDHLAVFSLDRVDGRPRLVAHLPAGGRSPRDFNIDPSGRWLVVAHQESSTLASFALDPATGLPTGRRGETVRCGSPVCVVFA